MHFALKHSEFLPHDVAVSILIVNMFRTSTSESTAVFGREAGYFFIAPRPTYVIRITRETGNKTERHT